MTIPKNKFLLVLTQLRLDKIQISFEDFFFVERDTHTKENEPTYDRLGNYAEGGGCTVRTASNMLAT